jgi:glycine/D-amino acid oxidase-like deaminating enzyme
MSAVVAETKGQDVVIVGAGIIGSALAYHLRRSGARVAIVDRNQPATGTTASSFAYVNAASKRPYPYFRLNAAGMAEHAALREEIGDAPGRVAGGRLLWHRDMDEMARIEALVTESAGWGYRAEWLDALAVAELEPDLRLDAAGDRAAYFPDETAVDAPSLAKRLLDLAVGGGVKPMLGQPVIGLCYRGDRIAGVTLANGEQINASFVINCAGPDADHVAQLAGRRLPLSPEIGLITYATLRGAAVHRILDASGTLIRPIATGSSRLIVQDGAADSSIVRGEPGMAVAERTLASMRALLPADATLTLDRHTVGMRPIPADGVTSAGLSTAIPGYGEIVTHSGVTLGPLLGRLIAREIAGEAPDPLLAEFRPERFA